MKKLTAILMGALIVVAIILLPFLKEKNYVKTEQKNYGAILTVWQIDSFEGGVGSRTSFLKKVANKFTKSHSGILFLVTAHTVESATNSLKNNDFPDVISFGACGLNLVNNLYALNSKSNFNAGQINGKQYVTAWCKGGYFLIKKGQGDYKKTIVSEGEYNSALIALCLEDLKASNLIIKSPKEAYSTFLDGNDCQFIGTQRDVVRLQNRNEEFLATPLTSYSDLYQYVAVTSTDQVKRQYAKSFIDYLLSKDIQKTLTDVKMLSVNIDGIYSDNESYAELEKVKTEYTMSPFASKNDILTAKKTAQNVINGKNNKSELLKFIKQL